MLTHNRQTRARTNEKVSTKIHTSVFTEIPTTTTPQKRVLPNKNPEAPYLSIHFSSIEESRQDQVPLRSYLHCIRVLR